MTDTPTDFPKRIRASEFIRQDEQRGVLLAGMWRGRRHEFWIPEDNDTPELIEALRRREAWVDVP